MEKPSSEVVSILETFRLATPRLLERHLGKSPTQIKNELRRLRSKHTVESHPFIGKQVYYRLTESACKTYGFSRRLAGPLGPQAIRQYYGLLHFATHTSPPRHFLKQVDWKAITSELNPKGNDAAMPSRSLYFDLNENGTENHIRLGAVFVDGRTEPQALLQKARQFVAKHRKSQTLRQLVSQDEFLFAFVTESDGKADAIAEAAERVSFAQAIRLHVSLDLSFI